MRSGFIGGTALIAVLLACPVSAGQCPALLGEATQLVLVLARTIDAPGATLATFEREAPGGPWVERTAPQPAVAGKTGLGWGFPYRHLAAEGEPIKAEGDKRTPAGFYRLGPTFGFEGASRTNHLRLETDTHFCVDDVRSPHYSRIVSRKVAGHGTSGERMREIPLYRRGIVIDYPTDRAAKSGSCIFLHIWRGEGEGTVGCIALSEPSVANLQEWARSGEAVIAILPKAAVERFRGCLP